MTQRVLVTGAHGLLGSEVVPLFRSRFEVIGADLADGDITVATDVERLFREARPDLVIHCAAYTAVDRAESDEATAMRVNGLGTRNVADACARAGAFMVTFGSDYVFDGRSDRAYREDDPTAPLSVYGKSKLAGEIACAESGARYLSIRTQWLYGEHGKNFIFAILDRARKGEPLKVVDDQVGCPTWARELAHAVVDLVDAGGQGIVHFSNGGETSWYDFARLIVEAGGFGPVEIARASTASLSLPAARPAHSPLDKSLYTRITGKKPRDWAEAAREFIRGHLAGRTT
jgi:dTDP-4-dehydrorhamnose reductase